MSTQDIIGRAIGTHLEWRSHLISAIKTGTSEFDPNVVSNDINCVFGKWLHSGISADAKTSEAYKAILHLHAACHKEAGKILQLAISGKKDEATARMGLGSKFASTSESLIQAMRAWK